MKCQLLKKFIKTEDDASYILLLIKNIFATGNENKNYRYRNPCEKRKWRNIKIKTVVVLQTKFFFFERN